MSIHEPRPGDIFFNDHFFGGCEVRIIKRGIRKGWGDAVWIYLVPTDGRKIPTATRVLAMSAWPTFAKDMRKIIKEQP